jgi:hypothetical protein
MKTIVSDITGRKDFPVFNQMSDEQIIEYLSKRDWSSYEVEVDGNEIQVEGGEYRDTFRIIDVEIVDYRQL